MMLVLGFYGQQPKGEARLLLYLIHSADHTRRSAQAGER
jgi:hypothetical protein